MTVKLLETQERGNIKSSWVRQRESPLQLNIFIEHFVWVEPLCVLGYSDRMVKSQNISKFSWILLLGGNKQADKQVSADVRAKGEVFDNILAEFRFKWFWRKWNC